MKFRVIEQSRNEYEVKLTKESKRKVLWASYFGLLAAVFGYSYLTNDNQNNQNPDK